jgi:hypothetical protein
MLAKDFYILLGVYLLQNFAKFGFNKYDFNLYKGVSMEKMAQICQILKEKAFRSLNLYEKFQ